MIPVIPLAAAFGVGILAKCVWDAVNDEPECTPEPGDAGTLRLLPPDVDDGALDAAEDAAADSGDRLRRLEEAVAMLAVGVAARGARRDDDAPVVVAAAADDEDRLRRLEKAVAMLAKSAAGEALRP